MMVIKLCLFNSENLDLLVSGECHIKCCNIKQPATIVVCALLQEVWSYITSVKLGLWWCGQVLRFLRHAAATWDRVLTGSNELAHVVS